MSEQDWHPVDAFNLVLLMEGIGLAIHAEQKLKENVSAEYKIVKLKIALVWSSSH